MDAVALAVLVLVIAAAAVIIVGPSMVSAWRTLTERIDEMVRNARRDRL